MAALAPTIELLTDSACCAPVRVFLLVENRLLLQTLVRLIRKRSDLLVVGQSWLADGKAPDVSDLKCDVLLIASAHTKWILTNPGLGSEDQRGFKTVLIGMDLDEAEFMAAVRSGVTGYLLQDASASDVVAAVRAVSRGEAVCPPQLCSALFRLAAKIPREMAGQSTGTKPSLTLRQQQLVALVAKGLTNKEIASHLNLSGFTVRNHIHRILRLVNARSRSEAVETIRAHGYAIGA